MGLRLGNNFNSFSAKKIIQTASCIKYALLKINFFDLKLLFHDKKLKVSPFYGNSTLFHFNL